jgi:hypothetical protein
LCDPHRPDRFQRVFRRPFAALFFQHVRQCGDLDTPIRAIFPPCSHRMAGATKDVARCALAFTQNNCRINPGNLASDVSIGSEARRMMPPSARRFCSS